MNLRRRPRVVVLGMMTKIPVAGVVWQTVHYLVGFRRLGYDVHYVEAHARTPGMLMETDRDDGSARAAAFIDGVMRRFDLGDRWAFHALHDDGRCYGMTEGQLKRLYREAELLINLHGGTEPQPEHAASGRLVYVETDPVALQVELHQGLKQTIDFLEPHMAFFTYGENYGNRDCGLPVSERFRFRPTRQPVVIDLWEPYGTGRAGRFTTIGNWQQSWRDITFGGETYHWSKHHEFLKFIDLPTLIDQPLELALSSCDGATRRMLELKGWTVQDAVPLSRDLDEYRGYIGRSRAEFTVAKDQNVRLRSGWFSDRSATYLAAGRPVVTQETGFTNVLPTGRGLFAFSTTDEILEAIDAINADYQESSKAAIEIAREYFSDDVVLARLVSDLGSTPPKSRVPGSPALAQVGEPEGSRARDPEDPVVPTGSIAPEQSGGVSPPVFVLGAPYSGKGLLGWALAQHPAIVHVTGNEWLARFAADLHVRYEVTTRQGRRFKLDPLAIDRDRLYRAFGEVLNQLVLDEVAKASPRIGMRAMRWVDSTGGHSAAVPGLLRLFPGARFVHLVRDPESAARGLIAIPPDGGAVLGRDDVYERWLEVTRQCLELELAFGSERVLRVHYGDLAASPEPTLRRVFSFIGEPFSPESIRPIEAAAVAEPTGPSSVGPPRHGAAQRDARLLMDLLRREPPPAHGTDAVATISVEERFLEAARTGSFHQEAQSLSAQIQAAISSVVPRDRTVAVISKGDDELLAIEGRHGWHFPRTPDGTYAGYHPGSSDDAIQHLETLRTNGASYLVVPAPSMWWLDYYTEFTRYLLSKYRLVLYDPGSCVIFALDAAPSVGTDVQANLIRSARPGLQRVPSATSEKS